LIAALALWKIRGSFPLIAALPRWVFRGGNLLVGGDLGRSDPACQTTGLADILREQVKLYIETTVPNFLFADDAPEKKAVTEEFYKWIRISPDTLYISELVLDEINRAQPPLRAKLLDAVARLQAKILAITDEAEGLAQRYGQD